MLRIDIEGDKHPKTFKLVTDDSDGELARLDEIFNEVDMKSDDALRKLLDDHTADDLTAGVEIPTSEVGELAELLEGDWPDEADKIHAQAEDALNQTAEQLGDH